MKPSSFRSDCPLNRAIELLGDKWSIVILRDMLIAGKSSFGEFIESSEGIATNILSSKLKSLEQANLLEKISDPDDRKRYIYLPTDAAIALLPAMMMLAQWSGDHLVSGEKRERFEQFMADGPLALAERFQSECRERVAHVRLRIA